MGWIKTEDELPMMGVPVLAIRHDVGSQQIPQLVHRADTEYGWAWNTFGSNLPVYAENQAYFTHWMQVPEPPS